MNQFEESKWREPLRQYTPEQQEENRNNLPSKIKEDRDRLLIENAKLRADLEMAVNAPGHLKRRDLELQNRALRKHLDKLIAEGNRCLKIPEVWDDGLSSALGEAVTYLDSTEKRVDLCPKDVCPLCYHHVDSQEHMACMYSDKDKA